MSKPAFPGYQPAELIPREILFGNPENTAPQISPDGALLAYLAPLNNVLNVWVGPALPGGTSSEEGWPPVEAVPVTRDRDRGIRRYFWAQDSRTILYLQDAAGNENWRLYAVDIKSGETRDLTPYENVQVRIIEHSMHVPDRVLLALNRYDEKLHDAYRLDLRTGELSLAAKNPGNVVDWVGNAELNVLGCLTARDDGGKDLLIREGEDREWTKLMGWDFEDESGSGPICFSRRGQFLYYLDAARTDTNRLMRLDTKNKKADILSVDRSYDIGSVMVNPDTYMVEAVGWSRERFRWKALTGEVRASFKKIAAIEEGDFYVVSRDNADVTWIVSFVHDDGPVSYYVYDRRTGSHRFLFYHKPVLKNFDLCPMQPIRFKARDGLPINGYITYPKGARKRTALPLVLNVHGGPWARDSWGYDAEAQWLANRGYACLQVNYRGSAGFGKDFMNAGNKEWGGKMQDDLTDAVRWAVQSSIADPERIAIFGASYGGYAALAGAAFTPDVYACAVDIVGPSNLLTFIASIPPYWTVALQDLYKRIGNPETERELLRERSPFFSAARIAIPVLVAQGENDPRVKKAESEQIVKALAEKGIDHEYLLFPDEGHGFAKPENRMIFYRVAEKFLSRHLGGRYEE